MPALFFTCLCHFAEAQLTINSMVPGSGGYLKSQLWDVAIINAYPNAVDGKVLLNVKNVQTMQTVLSGVSGRFIIQPGSKIMQAQYVQPITYTYAAGTIVDQSPNGVLPAGQYLICYQLYLMENDAQGLASEDCIQMEVEPLSPLVLSFPDNGDTLESVSPDFAWTPPAPLAMFSNLQYDFLLAEVLTGQSATDAVQKNLPVQSTLALQQPAVRYPLQGRALEKGKTYAWQIVARDQNQFTAKSEVWIFTIKNDSTTKKIDDVPYVRIGPKPLASVFAQEGILKVAYHHELADSAVMLRVVNTRKPEAVLFTVSLPVKRGENFITYDLGRKLRLDDGECYEARFINAEGLMAVLRFYPKYNR